MHIDFAPPSAGTYNNAGSSRQLASYMEHEDLEDEQHRLALSAGNADVSLTGLAGAVDDTAHDSHLDGLFATLKPPLHLICDFSAGVLG